MNSNSVTHSIYNYGSVTRPNVGANVYDLVWRGLGYMYEFAPLLAGEVVGNSGDTLRFVDDGLWLSSQGDYSPQGKKWGWLPRAGYARAGQSYLATANNPSSWPASWSAWPGENGNGVVIGRDEAFFGSDDFTNAEFPYYPFPTDTTKRGFGVSMEVRAYQFGGGLSDAVILKYKLKNESPKALNKCYFGFYGDPHIGGANDYIDDIASAVSSTGPAGDPSRLQAKNTVHVWDADGIGTGGKPCGYLNFKFLRTPGNRDLTSLNIGVFDATSYPRNDALYYSMLSSGRIDTSRQQGDNFLNFGTGPFSLQPGESTYVSIAVFFSENYMDMLDDANYIYFASHWPSIGGSLGQQGGDPMYTINLTSPASGVVSGNVPISWNFSGTDPNAKVLVECSWDRGKTWKPIAWEHSVVQPLTWNTTGVRDGVNYLLRIVAYGSDLTHYFYDVSDQRFTVNNTGNARPELESPFSFEGTTISHAPLNIEWTSEDADNSSLSVSLFAAYNANGPWFLIHNGQYSSGAHSYAWDFSSSPNVSSCFLKITASDGILDTTLVSRSFALNQEAGHYQPNAFQHVAGKATADLSLLVINPSQLSGHTYEATFSVPSDTIKNIFIKDLNTNQIVLNNYRLATGMSTPLFDGLKLTVNDKKTDINQLKSKFNRPVLDSALNFNWTVSFSNRVKVPLDWFFAFNSLEIGPNGKYLYPGDTAINNNSRKVVVCPFYMRNIDSMQTAYALVQNALADSMWRPGRELVLRPQPPGAGQVSYQVNMNFTPTLRPTFGDTLWIITDKTITSQDVFRFVADSSYVTGVAVDERASEFKLFDNYPNPFNPTTVIKFQIPEVRDQQPALSRAEGSEVSRVTLKVYDLLGREVKTLVNEQMHPGSYSRTFDASGLSSGVYFYRLRAGEFVSVKRMMLLR
ncbi:MAG: T9SS type A sorting domain-containing protein [Ignavibacteriae bacterium]|nr:T9SS type A sorting domain-containing protein [Ignavibacteriota bacterium]